MKRIARLLAVSLVLLGVMLISLPARALAANPYPSPSEVYVAGQPVSDYTGSKYSYDPLTGTLTLIRGGRSKSMSRTWVRTLVRNSGALNPNRSSRNRLSSFRCPSRTGIYSLSPMAFRSAA